MSDQDTIENNPEEHQFPIVGIGASAGGLEALERFFSHVSQDSGIAYVVLIHSSTEQPQLLPEILQRSSAIAIALAENGVAVRPNQVYLIPPETVPRFEDNCIYLSPLDSQREVLTSIDHFFQSLAETQGNLAVGIILSGMGSDGTLGLKGIKAQEGLVLVQSEETASYTSMPRSAVLTGVVDAILPPEAMPETIEQYFQKKTQPQPDNSQEWVNEIFVLLRSQIGNDFSSYKKNTLTRRIKRRMSLKQVDTYSEYLAFLQENPKEVNALFREFLIGVTHFFRDPEVFNFLKEEVLPPLLNSIPEGETFRAWVPGCSTGEEVYSLAIILREVLDQFPKPINLQIFGTDIDQLAIDRAREGLFPASIRNYVSSDRLQRFFSQEGQFYRVGREIRYSVVFSLQDVLKDPPFSRLNFLSCRNLLIYLDESAQKRLLPLFHYVLTSGGILILGTSESIGSFYNLFETLNNKLKIFQRREVQQSSRYSVYFPTGSSRQLTASSPLTSDRTKLQNNEEKNFGSLVQDTLLENFAPTAILIESSGSILHVEGRTGKFLETVSGPPTNNIIDMAREGLRIELTSAIRAAVSSGKTATRQQIPIHNNGDRYLVKFSVKPLDKPARLAGRLLVLLEVIQSNWENSQENAIQSLPLQQRDQRIHELEKELQNTRESHQTTIEELESSNEELQATNEELESSNEELQATNEELESSKEELQSLNEELQTVNEELQNKVEELSAAEDDMQNFLNSTEIATVFVNNQMEVKRFTPSITQLINLIPNDVGRSIQQISTNLRNEELITDLQEVLRSLSSIKKPVQTTDEKWYEMQIIPYRTTDNYIQGAVLTFTDIDQLKQLEQELEEVTIEQQQTQRLIQELLDLNTVPLIVLDSQQKIIRANQPFYEVMDLRPEEDLSHLEQPLSEQLKELLKTQEFEDVTLVITSSNLTGNNYLISGKIIKRAGETPYYTLLKIHKGED